MAFFTANYIKQLVIEDSREIERTLKQKGADLRTYFDKTLPYSLYITLDRIINNLATEKSEFITALSAASGEPPDKLINAITNGYKKYINFYIDTTPTIDSAQLAAKLANFNNAVSSNTNIVKTLKAEFSKSYVVSNLSKRNVSVFIISPSFKTIQSSFGNDFRKNFDYSEFSDIRRNDGELDSPRQVVQDFLKNNFGLLQNLGHAEYDILSTTNASVKRGLVTPKLLSAILEAPKDLEPNKLARKFSEVTGQAKSRFVIRKKFESSKLVIEMLIESGFLLGNIESREENLLKAPLERSFNLGQSISKKILANPKKFFEELATSKTSMEFLTESIVSTLKGQKPKPYKSSKDINTSTTVKIPVVRPVLPKPVKTSTAKIKAPKVLPGINLTSLDSLIRGNLVEQIKRNMGTGRAKNVLNLRTGRLAESAKLVKLSESRMGMITAFYTYMKNPYNTFSTGGAQEYPKSRDPKLLISKSIREIAAPMVANRLRSVAV